MNTHVRQSAFTLIELLAVIAVITIWSCILVPRLAKAHTTASVFGAQCLNNQHQLAAAAIMYADDNNDVWLNNTVGQTPNWCLGYMSFNAGNTDNTNISLLSDPSRPLIASYIQKPQILHCPADTSTVVGEGRRVRSVSMNGAVGTSYVSECATQAGGAVNAVWLNGPTIGPECQTNWRTYGRTSQMVAPRPANLWLFIDEHPNSIGAQQFEIAMTPTGTLAFNALMNNPASYHNGACGISFADAHAELHPWIGQTIQNPVYFDQPVGHSPTYGEDSAADVTWLQQHTSAHY